MGIENEEVVLAGPVRMPEPDSRGLAPVPRPMPAKPLPPPLTVSRLGVLDVRVPAAGGVRRWSRADLVLLEGRPAADRKLLMRCRLCMVPPLAPGPAADMDCSREIAADVRLLNEL